MGFNSAFKGLKTSFRADPLNLLCGAGKLGKMSGCGQNEIKYAE
jgi:hypothetical protein